MLGEKLEASEIVTSEPCLASEPPVDDNLSKNLLNTDVAGSTLETALPVKLDEPKSAVEIAKNFGPVLRRTSKRIVLRDNKDCIKNYEVNDKTAQQKIQHSNCVITKQGSSCGKMGRRKGYRKTVSTAIISKSEPVRRGRGRPRTVNRDPLMSKLQKIVPVKSSKTPKKSVVVDKYADKSTVWTLVPKELVNSDFFKSHVIKMQEKAPRGKRPKRVFIAPPAPLLTEISQVPFCNRESMKVKFPKMLPPMTKLVAQKHQFHLPTPPSRPTVIYFNTPKNTANSFPSEIETNQFVSTQTNHSEPQQIENSRSQEPQISPCLLQKFGNLVDEAALQYIYDICQRDLQKSSDLLRDIVFSKKELLAECGTHCNQKHCFENHLPLCLENTTEYSNEYIPQSNGNVIVSESPFVQRSSYFPCRQVIVDSIRVLYDDEAVLGYA